jgi:chromosomal replication initiator protein
LSTSVDYYVDDDRCVIAMSAAEGGELWEACARTIRSQVSEVVWNSTFKDASVQALGSSELILVVPSQWAKERIEGRYLQLVRDAVDEHAPEPVQITVEVELDSLPPEDLELDDAIDLRHSASPASTATATAPILRDHLNPRYTFETFVTGASNRFAQAAALSVAERPAMSYNPLFIHGRAGLGKTHLLQAIGHYVRQNYPGSAVLYVSTETFLNEFVEAIRGASRTDFKRRYRNIDVLLVDDIQFMGGKEGLQEEFFHTFNTLYQANKQIVLSSDRTPDSIPTLEDRLRSRFKMGLITDIQPPDLETRMAILRKKAETEQAAVPPDVLEFIASHVTENIRELEGALIRVCAFGNLNNEPLTNDLARHVLADLISTRQQRAITPDLIIEMTSKMFGFSPEEIIGQRRHRPLVTARQIAMYVVRELTELSYPSIAACFGGRDHTTVIHAVEKIRGLMGERRQIYEQVTDLMTALRNGQQ